MDKLQQAENIRILEATAMASSIKDRDELKRVTVRLLGIPIFVMVWTADVDSKDSTEHSKGESCRR